MKNLKGGTNMKGNLTYGIFALVIFSILALGVVSAFGMGWNNPNLSDEEKTASQEKHEQIKQAIESNDYESWKSLMESQISEEQFNQITQMHKKMEDVRNLREQLRTAIQEGDSKTAQNIQIQLSELGFEKGFKGKSNGKGMGMHSQNLGASGGFKGQGNLGSCPYTE
jgi:hypothetical protein